MKNQVRAYFGEAKWFHERQTPAIEEYMRIVLPSLGYSLPTTLSFIGMGEVVTKEAFDWVISDPKITTASSLIVRFMDDMTSHKVWRFSEKYQKMNAIVKKNYFGHDYLPFLKTNFFFPRKQGKKNSLVHNFFF